MSTWVDTLAKHDPREKHQHIELVVVEPSFQRRGIGRMMMKRVLEEMDAIPGVPYLETDTAQDVTFYEKLGFQVTDTAEHLGTTIRFMQRRSTV